VKVEKSYQGLFSMACCAKPLGDIQPQETGAPAVWSRCIFTATGNELAHIVAGPTYNGPTIIPGIHLLTGENNPVSLPRIFILESRT
jgi:hypothetical protein